MNISEWFHRKSFWLGWTIGVVGSLISRALW